jgi:hypothetical protein
VGGGLGTPMPLPAAHSVHPRVVRLGFRFLYAGDGTLLGSSKAKVAPLPILASTLSRWGRGRVESDPERLGSITIPIHC